jgi:hypothetical protein
MKKNLLSKFYSKSIQTTAATNGFATACSNANDAYRQSLSCQGMLHAAATDLLQPRQEVINRILSFSRI